MNYNELKIHAETCQMAADEMAHGFNDYLYKSNHLSIFQSHCNFNLYFIYSIEPEVILHIKTIEFLNEHRINFKRKISIKELFKFDLIVNCFNPDNFEDFKKRIK